MNARRKPGWTRSIFVIDVLAKSISSKCGRSSTVARSFAAIVSSASRMNSGKRWRSEGTAAAAEPSRRPPRVHRGFRRGTMYGKRCSRPVAQHHYPIGTPRAGHPRLHGSTPAKTCREVERPRAAHRCLPVYCGLAGAMYGVSASPAPSFLSPGEVGLIEGRNLRPNYVIPLFMKFGREPMAIVAGDILIGKDGEPGTVSMVTGDLLEYCQQRLTVGGHVYHARLAKRYRELAPFISVFLNSRNGQALIRKQIAGGTTPTIRKTDIGNVPVLVPADDKCPNDIGDAVIRTQQRIIDAMDNLGPSKSVAASVGMREVDIHLPTNWAGGGAQRSSRIIS